ncbi:MAG: hypothetical protein CL947_00125 [Epsilonproteobacteria bacterium]|nr:hypothetical protein [Campylobacterota bacterium]|tara:strand:+ start:564 stop:1442 length:879 start_codon:yes stop_codon:yes gene_type:complete
MNIRILKSVILTISVIILGYNAFAFLQQTKTPIYTVNPAQENAIKNIIFDVGDVLFSTSRMKKVYTLLPLTVQHPSLLYKFLTSNIKQDILTMLHNVPANTSSEHHAIYHEGAKMPQIVADWMAGRSNKEVLAAIKDHLRKSNLSTAEKQLFLHATHTIFDSQQLVAGLDPITDIIKLVHALKNKGYKLYVLSNWDRESFPLMQEKHHELFQLFDGVMTSGVEGLNKPNPLFYKKLLTQYNLNPNHSIFIDDEMYNIQAANNLGINGIHKTSLQSVYTSLEKFKIITVNSYD